MTISSNSALIQFYQNQFTNRTNILWWITLLLRQHSRDQESTDYLGRADIEAFNMNRCSIVGTWLMTSRRNRFAYRLRYVRIAICIQLHQLLSAVYWNYSFHKFVGDTELWLCELMCLLRLLYWIVFETFYLFILSNFFICITITLLCITNINYIIFLICNFRLFKYTLFFSHFVLDDTRQK